jgi:hypothetical protein
LAAVLNFNQPWMKEEQQQPAEEGSSPSQRVNPARIGRFSPDSGRYVLTDEEISYITKHFLSMQGKRQDYLMNNKKQSHLVKAQEKNVVQISFRP